MTHETQETVPNGDEAKEGRLDAEVVVRVSCILDVLDVAHRPQ